MKRRFLLMLIVGLVASSASAQYVWLDEMKAVDPVLHAALKDHAPEARSIDRLLQARDEEAAQKQMAEVLWRFRDIAFSQTSSAAAVAVVKSMNVLIDAFSESYPQGCIELAHKQLSLKAESVLDDKHVYSQYLEAQRSAYEDGKNSEPIARMDVATMYEVVTNDLGLSDADIDELVQLDRMPASQACSLLKRFLNIEAVRENQRGQYARAMISSKRK